MPLSDKKSLLMHIFLDVQNVSREIMQKIFQRESNPKELCQISKDIQEQNTRAPILKDTVMCSDTGVTTMVDTQNKIVQAAAELNCAPH